MDENPQPENGPKEDVAAVIAEKIAQIRESLIDELHPEGYTEHDIIWELTNLYLFVNRPKSAPLFGADAFSTDNRIKELIERLSALKLAKKKLRELEGQQADAAKRREPHGNYRESRKTKRSDRSKTVEMPRPQTDPPQPE